VKIREEERSNFIQISKVWKSSSREEWQTAQEIKNRSNMKFEIQIKKKTLNSFSTTNKWKEATVRHPPPHTQSRPRENHGSLLAKTNAFTIPMVPTAPNFAPLSSINFVDTQKWGIKWLSHSIRRTDSRDGIGRPDLCVCGGGTLSRPTNGENYPSPDPGEEFSLHPTYGNLLRSCVASSSSFHLILLLLIWNVQFSKTTAERG